MFLKILIMLPLLFSYYCSAAEKTIHAAVAEGFIDGLHSKYLRYIADKLSLPISITTIPFARRLKETKLGRLDIIVGVQQNTERDNELVYISPSYESLSYSLYSLTKNNDKFKSYPTLQGKLIGVNRHSKYFEQFDSDREIIKIETKNLEQSINLVLHERTDLFIHYEQSTLALLKTLKLDRKISKTPYQPNYNIQHFIAISKNSPLLQRKKELQAIVFNGLLNNDFLRIRQAYYAQ